MRRTKGGKKTSERDKGDSPVILFLQILFVVNSLKLGMREKHVWNLCYSKLY